MGKRLDMQQTRRQMATIVAFGSLSICLLASPEAKGEDQVTQAENDDLGVRDLSAEQRSALAQSKFGAARELWEAGDSARAEHLFRQSYQLERSIGALLGLAQCLEDQSRVYSAWVAYLEAIEYARELRQPAREKHATERARALEGQRSFVHLVLSEPTQKLNGVNVHVGGERLVTPAELAEGIAVDGGTVEIVVSAPGYVQQTEVVEVPQREGSVRLVVQDLTPVVAPPIDPAQISNRQSDPSSNRVSEADLRSGSRGGLTTHQWGALATATAGVVAAVWAAVERDAWIKARDRAAPYCEDTCVSPYWTDQYNGGVTSQRTAIGLGAASVLLLGVSAGLFVWSTDEDTVTARVSPTSIAVGGAF